MTLVEFLMERIAEDEAVARAAIADDGGATEGFANQYAALIEPPSGVGIAQGGFGEAAARMITTYAVPARVLAECEAKRRIVELHTPEPFADAQDEMFCRHDQRTAGVWPCDTMRLLSSVYADHPDYDEAWRP